MNRWQKKVAVVTGASAGIGAATALDLVKCGIIVIGLARREEKIRYIVKCLPLELQSHLHARKCDVTNEEDVKSAFAWVVENFGGVDILINNAGVLRITELIRPNNTQDIKEMVDTNIMGVVYCTREAFNSMKTRNVEGHVVIINSNAGHTVPNFGNDYPSYSMYPATKFAITAMVETYRQEFLRSGSKVKITSISPGAVDTEIVSTNFDEPTMPMLGPKDVADAIVYAIGTPSHVQIHELIIKPMGESC